MKRDKHQPDLFEPTCEHCGGILVEVTNGTKYCANKRCPGKRQRKVKVVDPARPF
jgi:hypothetical protein